MSDDADAVPATKPEPIVVTVAPSAALVTSATEAEEAAKKSQADAVAK